MFSKDYEITKETFLYFISEAPSALIISIYCIAKYNEKYRLTAWCMEELRKRHFSDNEMRKFDKQFENFYDQMMNQDNL